MQTTEILSVIKEADMVLVGLGEEFNDSRRLRECPEYERGCGRLKEEDWQWMIPGWGEYCSKRLGESGLTSALGRLGALLEDKNYFVVATATDSRVALGPWKQGRIVMPCGSGLKKQCREGCRGSATDLEEQDRERLRELFDALYEGAIPADGGNLSGRCAQCGGSMILNNIYADGYDESGYLETWRLYTQWLQGTLQKRLAVLELGVNMRFPSVIRWPFEKIVFLNQQAVMIRVHEKLYQLTKETAEKGWGIQQNAIEWLRIL